MSNELSERIARDVRKHFDRNFVIAEPDPLIAIIAKHLAPQPAQPRDVWPDCNCVACEQIKVAVARLEAASPQPAAWQGIEATIYCEQCGKHVWLMPIPIGKDDLNPKPWGDIVCPECRFVIASITTPTEAVYALAPFPAPPVAATPTDDEIVTAVRNAVREERGAVAAEPPPWIRGHRTQFCAADDCPCHALSLPQLTELVEGRAATLRPRDETSPSIPWRTQAMVRLGWLRHKSLVDEADVPFLQVFIEGNGATKLPSRFAPLTDPALAEAQRLYGELMQDGVPIHYCSTSPHAEFCEPCITADTERLKKFEQLLALWPQLMARLGGAVSDGGEWIEVTGKGDADG